VGFVWVFVGCVDPVADAVDEAEPVVVAVDGWLTLLLLAVELTAAVLARMVRCGLVVALVFVW